MFSIEKEAPTAAFRVFVADALRAQADTIADAWLAALADDDDALSAGDAQFTQLRKQVPDVVRGLADFMRSPNDRSRATVIDRLRLHAELRREYGYDVQQLLTDYEPLSRQIFATFIAAVGAYPDDASPLEVAQLADRLRESLMEITSEAVGLYRKRERERRAELAKRLASFASAITHELKNPLGAAQAGMQMLHDKTVITSADQQERFTKLVLRNLLRVRALIDEIRALTVTLDTDRRQRQSQLDELVDKVFCELRDAAAEKDVALEIDGRLPAASVDAFRVEIILVNLIGNAIKYSDPAKAARWVRVSARPLGTIDSHGEFELTVADNGLGIPKALQRDVFRRQFRAHPEVAEGTGLGLSIAEEVAVAAGGGISFESVEGQGTRFRVRLPERRGGDASA